MRLINEPIVKAALWMLIALLSFVLMAVSVKELAEDVSTAQIIFFRSLIGLVVIGVIVTFVGLKSIKTQGIKKHLVRNTAHFVGQYGWFYGIAFLPLAQVFALEFTVPIWTAIAASIVLNEVITKIRIVSIVLGLVGVIVILRPTVEIIHPAAIVVLVGAMAFGFSHVLTRSIMKQDSALSVIFYMCLIQLPFGAVLSFGEWIMPTGIMWFWLVLVGVTAMSAHYSMSKALSHADAMVVVPMDFLRLPVIILVGMYFYNESAEWCVILGASIMFLGNYLNMKSERSNARK